MLSLVRLALWRREGRSMALSDALDSSSVGLSLPTAFAFSKEYSQVEATTVLQTANALRFVRLAHNLLSEGLR